MANKILPILCENRQFTTEEAFVYSMINCNDLNEIKEVLNKVNMDIGTNLMDAYDDFVTKYSNLRYCYGCNCYHDPRSTKFIAYQCEESYNTIVNINRSLNKQISEHKQILRDEYYHR